MVDKVIVENGRAVGVVAVVANSPKEFRTDGEIIISAGGLMSPQILERSGIGAGVFLRGLGIEVVADNPGVGEHMLEHRLMMLRYELTGPYSHNLSLRGARLIGNVLRYYLTRGGPMAAAYGVVGAFARVLAESKTPDVEILCSPAVAVMGEDGRLAPDRVHSVELFGYPLRSRSEGSVHITSADLHAPAKIHAGYLTDPYDQEVTLAMHRFIRRWMQQPAIAPMLKGEAEATRRLETDDQILHAYRTLGGAGYHACGTCRMGSFNDAVLDSRLQVRGVAGLRVVDGSIMPAMVSANTNGPIMASAWRAASAILEDCKRSPS